MKPRLIVHGGAWSIPEKFEQDHIKGVHQAVAAVYPDLASGMSALDTVEAAVKILEDDPTFDAGRGAFLNAFGEIELDAMIMDGVTLNFGALAAVQNILHPITLARMIMEKTEHCMLVGAGAQHFAEQIGVKAVDPRELLTARELEFYNQIKNDPEFKTKNPFESFPKGTVGAVARDIHGNIAAATSTGGTPRKLPGRVGDSPIIGAGAYADNRVGGCSATGWGESIMKVLLSKTACDFLTTHSAMRAAELSVAELETRVQGLGGLILVDRNGSYGFAHNTSKMAFAFVDEDGNVAAKIRVAS
ncbi:MAG TPA: asparaginase [bacterium]|nr:asparaginase [bacterium]